MPYTFSPHIAVQVKNYQEALKFYKDVLGFEVVKEGPKETHFRCGEFNFYIEDNLNGHTFLEFKVPDVEKAKEQLVAAGCKADQTQTPELGTSYMITDPYGMKFHIYQPTS
jgi:catechol 2,3-dioxygenase-like lactoylglutathione lyase family enzyme